MIYRYNQLTCLLRCVSAVCIKVSNSSYMVMMTKQCKWVVLRNLWHCTTSKKSVVIMSVMLSSPHNPSPNLMPKNMLGLGQPKNMDLTWVCCRTQLLKYRIDDYWYCYCDCIIGPHRMRCYRWSCVLGLSVLYHCKARCTCTGWCIKLLHISRGGVAVCDDGFMTDITAQVILKTIRVARCGPGAISLPSLSLHFPPFTLSFLVSFTFLFISFLLALPIFLLFHPVPFYQNTSTPFPGRML